jgi:hypothetical protein
MSASRTHHAATTPTAILVLAAVASCAGGAPSVGTAPYKAPLADTDLFPIGGGYIDRSGEVVLRTPGLAVGPFSEGLAPFFIDTDEAYKTGWIDRAGAVVIAAERGRPWMVHPFSEGLVALQWDAQGVVDISLYQYYTCEYLDRAGVVVVEAYASDRPCRDFHDGLASATIRERDAEELGVDGFHHLAGYIDTKGKWVFGPGFYATLDFSDGFGLACVERGHCGFIDRTGHDLPLPSGWEPVFSFSEGLASIEEKATGRLGFISTAGKLVFQTDARYHSGFSEGLAPVDVGGRFGYVDRTGKLAIAAVYACAKPFSDGLARVCRGTRHDERYIDRTGREVFIDGPTKLGERGELLDEPFKGGLQHRTLRARGGWDADGKWCSDIVGYRDKFGMYVWVSREAELFLDAEWFRTHYVGPRRAPDPSLADPERAERRRRCRNGKSKDGE